MPRSSSNVLKLPQPDLKQPEQREISYQQFLNHILEVWRPGQHLTIIGETGVGKTWIAADVLQVRKYIIMFATKRRDKTISQRYEGFRTLEKWRPQYNDKRILFWPKPRYLGDFELQRVQIWHVLNQAFEAGGWTLYFDDLFYVCNALKLGSAVQMLYTQTRSEGITLVACMQRPSARTVPREIFNQSTFLVMFRLNDDRDVETVAEESGIARRELKALRDRLSGRDFIFIQRGKSAVIVRN